jgi:hypothetical protein
VLDIIKLNFEVVRNGSILRAASTRAVELIVGVTAYLDLSAAVGSVCPLKGAFSHFVNTLADEVPKTSRSYVLEAVVLI